VRISPGGCTTLTLVSIAAFIISTLTVCDLNKIQRSTPNPSVDIPVESRARVSGMVPIPNLVI